MGENGTFWLPFEGSTIAPELDALFYFVYWASVIIFVGTMGVMAYFVYKYRRRDATERPLRVKENPIVELSWVVVPTILVLVVFVWGFQMFVKMNEPPADAYEIRVSGAKWFWQFEYPNGTKTSNEFAVPANRPVRLTMSSEDVIHSFFIPAFRVKQDVLPGRYTSLWFEATRADSFQVFCTEYCGTQHSGMLAKVTVLQQDEFNEWVKTGGIDAANLSPVEQGEALYTQQGCQSCHSVDGTQLVGPTMQGLYGSQEQLVSGETVEVDENYLRESILQPGAKIVAGYQNIMPASYSNLTEDQLAALIAYIKEQ